MILTGRRVGADQALAYGLVNRVTAAGQAMEGARALAAEILDGSPTSVRLSLQAMAETRAIGDVIDAVTSTADVVDELMGSADSAEGVAAFGQKRRPVWRNY
jgi:acetyl-CoA C-acetyltransferase